MKARILACVVVVALAAVPAAAAGPLKGWGSNDHGQLDNGIVSFQAQATPEHILGGIRAAGAGQNHSLAVKKNGAVVAFGANTSGQLGNGTTSSVEATPVDVVGVTDVTAVAAGWNHSLALRGDGTVWAWGANYAGQLGDGTTTSSSTPVQVVGLSGIVAIDAELGQSFAVGADGTLWAWGDNAYGKLGDGTTTSRSTPVQVLTGVVAVAAGANHTLALTTDGAVWTWGNNWFGQAGNGTQTDSVPVPQQVPGLAGISAVGAGYDHSLAVGMGGTVFAWGYNLYGQVDGVGGGNEFVTTPVQVSGLTGVVAATGGANHSLAVEANGASWGWGSDANGQLGDGVANLETQPPTRVLGKYNVLVAGQMHSLGF